MASLNDAITLQGHIGRIIDRLRADEGGYEDVVYPWVQGARSFSTTGDFADAVAGNAHLKSVAIMGSLDENSHHIMVPFLRKLFATHPSLAHLLICHDIRENGGLSDELMSTVAEGLKSNTNLKKLSLICCNIKQKGSETLFRTLLHHNTTLEELYLRGNAFPILGTGTATESTAEEERFSVSETFEKISLKRLTLVRSSLGDELVKEIFRGLRKNKSMWSVDLSGTGITDESSQDIAETLRHNSSLRHLRFNGNSITDTGAAILEGSLRHDNHALMKLSLRGNTEEEEEPMVTSDEQSRIDRLCRDNRRIHRTYGNIRANLRRISPRLCPAVFELVQGKPSLLYAVLRSKPDLWCRERSSLQNTRKRRRDAPLPSET